MFKKVIIFLIVFVCLATLAAYLFTRPRFVAKVVKSVVNARTTDWVLEDLTLGKIRVDQNGLVSVTDVRFTVSQGKERWQGAIPVVHLDNFPSFVAKRKMTVDVAGARVGSQLAQLQGISAKVTVTLAGGKWQLDDGSVRVDFLAATVILLKEIEAIFHGNQDTLTADPWAAKWAEGNLSGRLTASQETYTIHAELSQVDLSQIAVQVSEMRGRVDGTVDLKVQRATNEITALKGYLDAPQGTELHAVLLQPLLAYIPVSTQKQILEQLIAANANVFFDHADVRLENVQNDSLHLSIELDSKKLNLDIGVTVDLHVDGGLKGLFGRLPQFLSS